MTRALGIAGDHRDDGLTQTRPEFVALKDKRGSALGSAQIGIGKQNQNNVTAPGLYHRRRLRGVLSPRRKSSDGREGQRLEVYRYRGREGARHDRAQTRLPIGQVMLPFICNLLTKQDHFVCTASSRNPEHGPALSSDSLGSSAMISFS
jgi:hypothetical protein